jgi:anti-sigma-K factor RskA
VLGAAVAVAAVVAGAFVIGRSTAPGPALRGSQALATLAPLDDSGVRGDAHVARSGAARVIRLHLKDLKGLTAGEYYELWLGNADGRMIGLASFAPRTDGSVDVTVPLPVETSGFSFVDVSLEPADGNPAHSALSIARGPLAS